MRIINKRSILVIFISLIGLLLILLRVGYVVILKGDLYVERAYELWLRNIPVSANRGKIYDCNGELIVGNTISPSLSIIPKQVTDKEYTINYLSSILEVDKSQLEKHFNKNVSVELIKPEGKNISLEKAKQIISKDLDGVYVSGDVVRYYPYGNVLTHVIGIVGSDNQGLTGLEYVYNDILTGTYGSIDIFTDAHGLKISNKSNEYKESNSGLDIYLTIDIKLQVALENVVDNARELYDSEETMGLIMRPNTSEILAICSRPNFDLSNYQDYDESIYNRNLPIWMSFEPGSTFKIVTYAAGIEEGVFNPNESFYDPGYAIVDGVRIRDWKVGGHGSQTFYEVIQNSCNPGFVNIGLRLGKDKLFYYINQFGFGKKTGVDLLGESTGIIFNKESIGNVELATSSFGQGNSVTPIQLVNAACAIVNGGILNKPYILYGIGFNNLILYTSEVKEVRRVISKKTSDIMRDALERVVSLGTARSSYVEGYRVGGKTATAQIAEDGVYVDGKYILSFLGIAPMNDPEVACYIAIKEPKNTIQYGGVVAAPLVRDIITQSFSILDIKKQEGGIPIDSRWYVDDFYYEVENYIGKEVKKIGIHPHYKFRIEGNGKYVIDQVPSAGEMIVQDNYVTLYT